MSLDTARAIDTDLAAMRGLYPAFVSVHVRPVFVPKTLLITLNPAAPWRGKWDASATAPAATADTALATGEAALDALLQKYGAARIAPPIPYAPPGQYQLLFAQPLNLQIVADEMARSSSNIASISPNAVIGDGDDIVFTPPARAGGDKTYVFSQGFGDCGSGGCIYHYDQPVVIPAHGAIYQTPVPPPPQ